jgi:uncharacterized protein YoxC
MTTLTKILTIAGIIVAIAAIAFMIYRQEDLKNQQTAIQTQMTSMQQLQDGIVRAQSQYATTTDLQNFANQNNLNLSAIQANLQQINAQLASITQTTIVSSGQSATGVGSTSTTPNPTPTPTPTASNSDPYGYLSNTQTLQLNEDFSGTAVPFGSVGFSAWQAKPWQYTIQPRQYNVTTVVAVDENQKQTLYNKFSINTGGKSYDVAITNSQTLQQYPSPTFSFWNPRLFLTSGAGINVSSLPLSGSANAGLTLGIMSWGQYKTTPTLSILQVGAAYQSATKNASLVINPINFNIGSIMPKGLVDNTYLGPSVQIDSSGRIFTGINLSVGF